MLALPLVSAFASNPMMLEAGWNEGKGSLILVLVFIAIEGLDATYRMNRTRILVAGISSLSVSVLFYFDPQSLQPLTQLGSSVGVAPNLLPYSWHEFLVTLIYLALTLVLILSVAGARQFRGFLFTLTYTALTAIVLLLDAVFPYDELGPLQSVVPVLVSVATGIMRATSLVSLTSFGNTMVINANGTARALVVYWPSAGVHSFLIFTGIAIAFLLKQRIGGIRFLIYAVLGAFGTISVNVIRIILLAYYTAYYPAQYFQSFHDVIGEILFLPWLVTFMLIVHYSERRLRARAACSTGMVGTPPESTAKPPSV